MFDDVGFAGNKGAGAREGVEGVVGAPVMGFGVPMVYAASADVSLRGLQA